MAVFHQIVGRILADGLVMTHCRKSLCHACRVSRIRAGDAGGAALTGRCAQRNAIAGRAVILARQPARLIGDVAQEVAGCLISLNDRSWGINQGNALTGKVCIRRIGNRGDWNSHRRTTATAVVSTTTGN